MTPSSEPHVRIASIPAGFVWGAATSAYQIEGSPLRGRRRREHLAPLRRTRPAAFATATPATWPATTTGAGNRRRADGRARPSRPIASRSRGRAFFPEGRGAVNEARPRLLRAARRPPARARHRRRSSRSTTGICRPRSTIAAAGSTPTSPTGSPTTPSVAVPRSTAIACRCGRRSTSPGSSRRRLPARRATRRATAICSRRRSPRTTCCARMARRSRLPRGAGRTRSAWWSTSSPRIPRATAPQDVAATARAHAYMNRQYLDPLFLGRYPDELRARSSARRGPTGRPRTWRCSRSRSTSSASTTTRARLRATSPGRLAGVRRPRVPHAGATTRDRAGSSTRRVSTRHAALGASERYGDVPLYVTENGGAFDDPPVAAGACDDPLRVDTYRQAHLRACRAAIARASTCAATYAWSLLDNLEWARGTRSDSAWCTWISKRRCARSRTAESSTAT